MNAVASILSALERDRFYGAIELKYEAGRVVLLRKTETIKPASESCRDTRGVKNEHSDGF